MAFEADLRLRRSHQDRVARCVAGVTVGARYFIHIVVIAMPAEAGVRRMTIQARAVLNLDRGRRIRAEIDSRGRPFLAATNTTRVIAGRPVARFALQLAVAERAVRVSRIGVRTAEQSEGRIFLVAGKAGVGALATVASLLTVSRADGQSQ